MSDPFIGEIRTLGFNWAPVHWAKCDGQLLPVSQNAALFSLLGTNFGGNGSTTFGVPDLRSRIPIHYGTGIGLSYRPFAYPGGLETTILNQSNLPQAPPISAATVISGEVAVQVSDSGGNAARAVNNAIAKVAKEAEQGTSLEVYDSTPTYDQGNQLAGVAHDLSATTQVTGGLGGGTNTPFNNMQPYLALNYCIALLGIYPSRS